MGRLRITETILRDAHQSLLATRMPLSDMLPILPLMDQVGFHSVECWGGATYDACLRFLGAASYFAAGIAALQAANALPGTEYVGLSALCR